MNITESIANNAGIQTIIGDWTTSKEGKYTANQVIDAYKFGASQQEKLFQSALDTNFKAVNEILVPYFDSLLAQDSKAVLRLKISDYSSFEASISLDADFYLDQKESLFESASAIEDKLHSEILNLHINFLPLFENVNEDILLSNGYNLKYTPKA